MEGAKATAAAAVKAPRPPKAAKSGVSSQRRIGLALDVSAVDTALQKAASKTSGRVSSAGKRKAKVGPSHEIT